MVDEAGAARMNVTTSVLRMLFLTAFLCLMGFGLMMTIVEHKMRNANESSSADALAVTGSSQYAGRDYPGGRDGLYGTARDEDSDWGTPVVD